MRQNKKFALIALLLSIIGVLAIGLPAHADDKNFIVETGCDTAAVPSFTGTLPLPKNTYDVYVKLGKRGQVADVRGYSRVESKDSKCQSLGSIKATGDTWKLLGTLRDPAGDEQTTLQLSSPLFENLVDANRPALMLVAHSNPLCRPSVECEIQVDGQTGYVRPSGTLLNQNSLHVLRVTDPQKDVVHKVRYYVDDQLVYTKPTLMSFDMRYVSSQGQRLSRVVEYRSGQQVVLEEVVPDGFLDTFPNFVFKIIWANPGVVKFALWLIGLAAVLGALRWIAMILERRRQWKYDHGFLQHMTASALTERDKRRMQLQEVFRKTLSISTALTAIAGAAACLVLVTNAFVMQVYSVNGDSMEASLHDGQKLIVNKLPRSLANLNQLEYVPERGDIVVAHMVFGVTATDDESNKTETIVKRVLGLPGERIVVENGTLTVYNAERPEGFQPDKNASWTKTMKSDTAPGRLEITLGASELFVSGDNRPGSIDSRFNGPISTKQVIGPVLFQRAF